MGLLEDSIPEQYICYICRDPPGMDKAPLSAAVCLGILSRDVMRCLNCQSFVCVLSVCYLLYFGASASKFGSEQILSC